MPQRLLIESLESIGAVDKGDNPAAPIVFHKRLSKHALPGSLDEAVDEVRRAWREANPERDGQPFTYVSAVFPSFAIVESGDDNLRVPYVRTDDGVTFGTPEQVDLQTDIVAKHGRPATLPATNRGTVRTHEGETMDRPDLSGIEDEQLRDALTAAFDAAEQRAQTAEDDKADLEKRLADLEDEGEPDPLAKADPAVRAEIERLRKSAEEADGKLAEEVAKRRDAEFAAKPYMKLLGADQVEAVRKLADADPEAFAKVETQLTALEQRTDLAKIFAEFGTSEGEGADPVSKRDAWVAEHRKANPDVSIEKARAEFWKAHPDERKNEREGVR